MLKLGVEKMENSYSGYGWKGVNSSINLSMAEMGKIIKEELKKRYPTATFSVSTKSHWSCSTITIKLMKDSKNPFNTYEDAVTEANAIANKTGIFIEEKWSGLTEREIEESNRRKEYLKQRLENGVMNINEYFIDEEYELSSYGKGMFKYIKELCDSFNYDDSDAMTDYFNRGFYETLGIGKYEKKFELVKGA